MPRRSIADPRLFSSASISPSQTASVDKLSFLDFFAGSGLVTEALRPFLKAVWANDICEKKAAVYRANHPGDAFHLGPIEEVEGTKLPPAVLSWASFPCQDLSLAGNRVGIDSNRSGLVWHWLRIMDEMAEPPPVVVAENVLGLVSMSKGGHYGLLHAALTERGYRVGPLVIDAVYWVPQSRPRVFVIGVKHHVPTADFESNGPIWVHPAVIQKATGGLRQWIWWSLPKPRPSRKKLEEIIDLCQPCDEPGRSEHNLRLIPRKHRQKIELAAKLGHRIFPGYKRTRSVGQVLELRFDGIAGCLRTPEGGSSRQLVVLYRDGRFQTRLLSIQEAALLMGVRKSYKIPGSYNEGYRAIGDAVAVPVARYLARHLLVRLARRAAGGERFW